MKVGDLLKIKGFTALTIAPDATIGEAATRLKQERIGALVVSTDGRTIEGIISERDIAFGLAEYLGKLHQLQVAELMSRNVLTCKPDDTIAEASRIMNWRGFRHLPVEENGKLVGILSIKDILRNRITDLERISTLLRDCITATE